MLDEETTIFYTSKGEAVWLGRTCTELLSYILNNKNRYIPYDELIKILWNRGRPYKLDNRLKQNVYMINKKLRGELKIVSKYCVGYMLGERKKKDGKKRKRNCKLV